MDKLGDVLKEQLRECLECEDVYYCTDAEGGCPTCGCIDYKPYVEEEVVKHGST